MDGPSALALLPGSSSWPLRLSNGALSGQELVLEHGSYRSSPEICTSDHSPVAATFRMSVMRPYHMDLSRSERRLYIRLSQLKASGLENGDHHITFKAQYMDEDRHTPNASSVHGRASFQPMLLLTKQGVSSRKWLQSRHLLCAIYKVDDALESAHMPLRHRKHDSKPV